MTASACWISSRALGYSVSSEGATAMSAHLSFLAALERLPRVESRVMATALGRCRPEFLQRRWITEEDYLTHVMVPFLNSEQEVEVEIDQDAAVYRYLVNREDLVRLVAHLVTCREFNKWLATGASCHNRARLCKLGQTWHRKRCSLSLASRLQPSRER